jgi:plasmid stability protein
MSQITWRHLPDSVEEAIRKRAAQRHISLNRASAELLEQALGLSEGQRRDLSDLAGTWSEGEVVYTPPHDPDVIRRFLSSFAEFYNGGQPVSPCGNENRHATAAAKTCG